MEFVHVSVMPEEVISWAPQDARLIVDGTAGEAGHTLLLARRCPNARILAFDRDPEMLERARKKLGLAGMENRVELIRGSFGEIPEHTREADFILLDLGVSMHHFRGAGRGFSYTDDSLDMRLDPDLEETAADIINHSSEKDLKLIFQNYGEERFAGRIARAIVQKRPVRTARDLSSIILGSVPRSRSHPATRVFQALRIAVNDELGEIERALPLLARSLAPGGRLAVISFHSLEDRIVKHGLRALDLKILTKKPLEPTEEEVRANPASRSARLRVAEKPADNAGEGP